MLPKFRWQLPKGLKLLRPALKKTFDHTTVDSSHLFYLAEHVRYFCKRFCQWQRTLERR
jgi:hypothetical protein